MASPLEKFNSDYASRWEIFTDIPEWEKVRVLNWMQSVLHKRGRNQYGNETAVYDSSILPFMQQRERIMFSQFSINISSWASLSDSLRLALMSNIETFILILEILIKYLRDYGPSSGYRNFYTSEIRVEEILAILESSLANGSKWKVVTRKGSRSGVRERVNPHIVEIAQKLLNTDLDDAWSYAYGTSPDPKLAIEKAQNAIEHFASLRKLTTTSSAVYNVLLGDIKVNPTGYTNSAKREYAAYDNANTKEPLDGYLRNLYPEWFWKGMDLIQKTNVTRHKNGENLEFEISVGAARQAVLIATLYCELINAGHISRKIKKPLK